MNAGGADVVAKLAELRNRATRYEMVAVIDGERYLLGYSTRPSRMELLRAWRAVDESVRAEVVRSLGITDATPARYSARLGWAFGDRLALRKSGRTQRDALLEGELARLRTPGLACY